MASSDADYSSVFKTDIWKAVPFLKQYAKYKVPQFDSKGFEAPKFDPYQLAPLNKIKAEGGVVTMEQPSDLSKYQISTLDDALEFQRRYGEMANQQAVDAFKYGYDPLIQKAKEQDLRLQLAGDIYSPTKAANRNLLAAQSGLTAAQNFAAGAGAESNLNLSTAALLGAATRSGQPKYAGQTFTA